MSDDKMDDAWIEEQLALCEAATPDPWEIEREEDDAFTHEVAPQDLGMPFRIGPFDIEHEAPDMPGIVEADVLFVHEARANYKAVLLELRRVREAIAQAHEAMQEDFEWAFEILGKALSDED